MTPPQPHGRLISWLDSPRSAVFAALVLRVLALGLSYHFMNFRLHHYHSQGLEAIVLTFSLVDGHGYSFPFPNFVYTAWLAPFYVWILTAGHLLFPKDAQMVNLFGQIINILFSALTCYSIFALGKKIGGRTIGIISAWTWAFLPVAILMPIAFTWDQSLAALLLAQLFVFSYILVDSSSLPLWCAYGLLWGIAALTNPSLFILFPCFAAWFCLSRQKSQLPTLGRLVAAAAVCLLVMVPWTLRNYHRLGGFTFVKSNFGTELWLGNNPEVKTVWTPNRNPLYDTKELDQMVSIGELAYNRGKAAEAVAYITANPSSFLRQCFYRFADTWIAYYDTKTDFYIQPLGIRPVYILFSALFSLATFTGMLALLAEDFRQWIPVACAVVIFPIPYYITHSSQRYRHPVDPILTLLAVYGVSKLWRHLRGQAGASDRQDSVDSERPIAVSSLG